MDSQKEEIFLPLLISGEDLRSHLSDLLKRSNCTPILMTVPDELLYALKGKSHAIIFLDSESVRIYGAGIYAKIRGTCEGSRTILLCDQSHRDLIKEAMESGAYGCILEPYPEWEIVTMVRHILADIHPSRRKTLKKAKKIKEESLKEG